MSQVCYNQLTMQDQIVRYIAVLKDRKQITEEYEEISADRPTRVFYTAQKELLDDIIAELEGFVKAQNHTELMRQALMEAYGEPEKEWTKGYREWKGVSTFDTDPDAE